MRRALDINNFAPGDPLNFLKYIGKIFFSFLSVQYFLISPFLYIISPSALGLVSEYKSVEVSTHKKTANFGTSHRKLHKHINAGQPFLVTLLYLSRINSNHGWFKNR
jgi:hypothetical protein